MVEEASRIHWTDSSALMSTTILGLNKNSPEIAFSASVIFFAITPAVAAAVVTVGTEY